LGRLLSLLRRPRKSSEKNEGSGGGEGVGGQSTLNGHPYGERGGVPQMRCGNRMRGGWTPDWKKRDCPPSRGKGTSAFRNDHKRIVKIGALPTPEEKGPWPRGLYHRAGGLNYWSLWERLYTTVQRRNPLVGGPESKQRMGMKRKRDDRWSNY